MYVKVEKNELNVRGALALLVGIARAPQTSAWIEHLKPVLGSTIEMEELVRICRLAMADAYSDIDGDLPTQFAQRISTPAMKSTLA
jgi:hypothetical protein